MQQPNSSSSVKKDQPPSPEPPVGAPKSLLTPLSGVVLVCVLAVTLQIAYLSPIAPDPLHLPPQDPLPKNHFLQKLIKLGDGEVLQPEDVVVDKHGTVYASTRDGWVKRLPRDGKWENWQKGNKDTLLGLTVTRDGDIVACDAEDGLLKFNDKGATLLTSHVNGTKLNFIDDVVEAPDGSFYFSCASNKYKLADWFLDVLEAKPHGQLLRYDPSTGETSVLLDGLAFANGVAVSQDETFLVVCEAWKFRCIKYWLQGEQKGTTEIFIENLPGGPDNINLAPDGTFWIGLLQLTREGMNFLHGYKVAKHLVVASRKLNDFVSTLFTMSKATVVNVAADGTLIRKLEDPDGSVISFVTNAFEFEDHLYLGNLQTSFVGKVPLKDLR